VLLLTRFTPLFVIIAISSYSTTELSVTLTYEEIGKPIDKGSKKVAYTLKNHPDLLFLQLGKILALASLKYLRV
jgi:hypothetical protein